MLVYIYILVWEPSAPQVTKSYCCRLPALKLFTRKLTKLSLFKSTRDCNFIDIDVNMLAYNFIYIDINMLSYNFIYIDINMLSYNFIYVDINMLSYNFIYTAETKTIKCPR